MQLTSISLSRNSINVHYVNFGVNTKSGSKRGQDEGQPDLLAHFFRMKGTVERIVTYYPVTRDLNVDRKAPSIAMDSIRLKEIDDNQETPA